MNTIETGPSNNARDSEVWSRSWTHFRVDRRSPRYCHVTFDHPPINTITATTVRAPRPRRPHRARRGPQRRCVRQRQTGISTLPIMTWRTTPAGLRHSGSVPLDCRPGSTSLSVWLVPRWSASPRSGGAPAAPGASSFSPVICGSPLARTCFSASGKLASEWFPGAVRWLGSPAWSVAAGHSRSSSWPTISMDRARSNMDTSTG